MRDESIPSVKQSATTRPRSRQRERRLSRAIHARRRLNSPRGGGRAWINGREVGGTDPRYSHLATVND